jgi:hypothetical protein
MNDELRYLLFSFKENLMFIKSLKKLNYLIVIS